MAESNVFAGMDLDVPDANGYTAAHKACLVGDWETLGQLMDQGADLRKEDHEGRSALWFAHLYLKATRAMAARLFSRQSIDFYVAPPELEEVADAEAKLLGKRIWEETSPPGPMRVA